jgi:hypothetical protein
VKGAALLVPDDHMLDRLPDATDFDTRRQLGELETVVICEAESRFLTETYTGWPRVHWLQSMDSDSAVLDTRP